MAPPPMENSTLNGSFLVLNLGNNTVGLGNSSAFPMASNAFNQNTVERTPNLNAISKMDTLSNSTEEASSASESQKGKRASREMEDPDWVPEKKARKSSGSASRTARPKQGTSVSKNTSEIPPVRDNSMFGSKSGPPPPYLVNLLQFFGWRVIFRPAFGDYLYISPNGIAYYSLPKAFETFLHGTSKYKEKAWSASRFRDSRGLDGTFVGGLSAGNVGLQSGAAAAGNFIAGLPASIVPLQSGVAYEGSSKKGKSIRTKNSAIRENTERGMTSTVGPQIGATADDNSIAGLPASNIPLQSGVAAEGSGKNGEIIKTNNSTIRGKAEPETTIEKPPQLKQNSVYKISKDSSNMPGMVVPEGANQVVSSSMVDEKTKSHVEDRCLDNESKQIASSCSLTIQNDRPCINGTCQDGELVEVRKSMQISGRHVPVGSEVDNAETNGNCSYLSTCRVSGNAVNAVRGKEEQKFTTSQAKIVLDNMPKVCMINQSSNNEVRKSKCSSMGVTRNTQSSKTSVENDNQVVGVRRSKRVNRKNVPVDTEVHAELMVENNLASSKSVVNTAARKNKGKSLVSESVIDEKMFFSMTGTSSGSEAQKLDCSNAVLSCQTDVSDMHQSGDVLGVRRSVRINGKHVRVDDELDVEMEVDDTLLDLSKFAANAVLMDEEELITKFSELNEEGRSPESDNMQLKQTNSKKSDSQKFRTHKQVESHDSRKSDKAKNPGSEKSSVSQKEIEVAKRKSAGGGNLNTKQKKKRNHGCSLIVRRNEKDDHHEEIMPRTKLTILSWLIDFGILTENEKVVYISKNSMDNILNGLVTRGGIWCDSCKEVEPLSKFKAHAGSDLYLPWDNIFLMSGKTLTQCLLESWEKEKKRNKVGFQTVGTDGPDPSDDTCGVCADGGHLICCDNCPSTFHQDCVMLKTLPEGTWYCPYCRCAFCMVSEHGSKRVPDTSALLVCKQCRRKYHQQCAWGNDINEMDSVPISFCGKKCKKLATQLSDMLGVLNSMEGGFSWTLLKCLDDNEEVIAHERLPFIVECNVKLSMALSVLNECFVPLVDQRTDSMGQIWRKCLLLVLDRSTKGKECAIAFSRQLKMYMLSSLCIKKLIIPAIPDLLEMWMKSFSFKPLEPSFKDEIRNLSMVVFARTNLLEKSICNVRAVDPEDMQTGNSINHGKNTKESDELPSTFGEHGKTGGSVTGDQDWWSYEYNTEGPKDDIPDPWRINDDFSEIRHSKVPNGSVFNSLSPYDTSMTNLETLSQSLTTAPLSFPPVNMVLDHNPFGTGIISTPDGQLNSLLQSVNEARDAQYDAVTCTLSFENLIRMRS
ncbi:increased DNA methylation 1-like [Cocos nucifera]|uniref:Increased DNA methylation 1-like n=1 Tax=Cocos nucifera TaxID=13894 RepID=A0A8K0MX34_COCNU|nr:increased DNA methylation 1-like [Cocos nucifera]